MTKITKIALGLSLLLTAFGGKGRAQETPCIIQQCMVNCVNTLISNFSACLKDNRQNLATCTPTSSDISTLQSCINSPTYNGASCPSNSVHTMSNYIAQSNARACFNTFHSSFNTCTPGLSGLWCVGTAIADLAKCITGIPANQRCIPPKNANYG